MAQNVESLVEQAESDKQFLACLDDHIAYYTIPVQRAKVARITSGDAKGYEETNAAYSEAMVRDDDTLVRITRLTQSPDPQESRLAVMIKRHVDSSEQNDLKREVDRILHAWRTIRASLSSPDSNIRGASSLLHVLLGERDPDQKHALFVALHARDEEMATTMIALRDARNAQTQQEGYANYFPYALARKGVAEEGIISEAEGWYQRMATLLKVSADWIEAEHFEDMYDTKDTAEQVVDQLGWSDAYNRISYYPLANGGESPRCIAINPPGEVAVVAPRTSADLLLKNSFFSEVGHALHYASMAEYLPYVFRVSIGELPWNEAMDALFRNLAMTYIAQTRAETPGDELKTRLTWVAYARSIGSLRSSLLRFFFDVYFYSTDERDPEKISEEWTRIKRRLYGKDFPLYRVVDTPDGYKGPLYEWANDHWITENPVDLDHLFGAMIAAQLRAYWLNAGGTLLSREFGEWIRRTCWEPGFSKPWRELLHDATGEHLNPQYFFDELEDMKNRFADA